MFGGGAVSSPPSMPSRNGEAEEDEEDEEWPGMLCLAEVTLYYHGEDIAVRAGQLCLVQGDREDESAPEGFVWCLAGQLNGLVPASHLKRLANVAGFTCQAIYDFTAADSGELSMIAGEYVMVQPSIEDPTGWVSATHKSSGECGLVPQSYVEPSGVTVSSPSAKTPQSSAAGAMATLIESGARVLREEATPDGDAPTLSAPTARDATGEKEDEDDEEELVMIGETPPGEKAQAVIPDSDSESPARPPVLTASRPARLEFPVSPVARHPFVPGQTRQMAAKDAPSNPSAGTSPMLAKVEAAATGGGSSQSTSPPSPHRASALCDQTSKLAARAANRLQGVCASCSPTGRTYDATLLQQLEDRSRRFAAGEEDAARYALQPVPSLRKPGTVEGGTRCSDGGGTVLTGTGTQSGQDEALSAAQRWHARLSAVSLQRLHAGLKPPPVGFDERVSMDRLFFLGHLLAKQSRKEAGGTEARAWRSRYLYLIECLQLWSEWQAGAAKRTAAAAAVLQATARRMATSRRFKVALQEARARVEVATQAATAIQSGQRRSMVAKSLIKKRHAALQIQRTWRGHASRTKLVAAATRAAPLRAPSEEPSSAHSVAIVATSDTPSVEPSVAPTATAPAPSQVRIASPHGCAAPKSTSKGMMRHLSFTRRRRAPPQASTDLTPRPDRAPPMSRLRRSLSFDSFRSRRTEHARADADARSIEGMVAKQQGIAQPASPAEHPKTPDGGSSGKTVQRRSLSFSFRSRKKNDQHAHGAAGIDASAPAVGGVDLSAARMAALLDE